MFFGLILENCGISSVVLQPGQTGGVGVPGDAAGGDLTLLGPFASQKEAEDAVNQLLTEKWAVRDRRHP